jgi:hypothetical protein
MYYIGATGNPVMDSGTVPRPCTLSPRYGAVFILRASAWPHCVRVFGGVAYPDSMFLGLPDPEQIVRGTDPDPDPFIIKQKSVSRIRDVYPGSRNLIFVFIAKNLRKKYIFVAVLNVTD